MPRRRLIESSWLSRTSESRPA